MTDKFTPGGFEFVPLFYLLDLTRDEHGRLTSIAVEAATEIQFVGVSFKEDNTGWSLNPIKIGRGYISLGKFDFTEQFEEAKKHAAINDRQSDNIIKTYDGDSLT